jgi:hypothetical protein
MLFPFEQIQTKMKFLVWEGLAGWKPDKQGDSLIAGTVVNGRYRIEEPLQQEGTRVLYRATLVSGGDICELCHLKDKRTPNLSCNYCEAKLSEKTFRMEVLSGQIDPLLAKKLLEISYPGVLRVYEIFSDMSNTYVVSEPSRGVTLDRLEEMLTVQEIQRIGILLTQTVEFLHRQGICCINLELNNLELMDERPRLVSLSTTRLKSELSQENLESADQRDHRALLETLEKLAAEYVIRGKTLWSLLVGLEEMLGKDDLSGKEIQDVLTTTID